jgi:hypothetical protein
LKFYGVDCFCIEGDGDLGLGWVGAGYFLERCSSKAITELIGEALAGVDGGVGGDEIETEAAVACFHAGYVTAADHHIVGGARTAPVITGEVPVDDVFGLCVALPYGVFGHVDGSRDSDFGSGV